MLKVRNKCFGMSVIGCLKMAEMCWNKINFLWWWRLANKLVVQLSVSVRQVTNILWCWI
jgi:hypothetical protein